MRAWPFLCVCVCVPVARAQVAARLLFGRLTRNKCSSAADDIALERGRAELRATKREEFAIQRRNFDDSKTNDSLSSAFKRISIHVCDDNDEHRQTDRQTGELRLWLRLRPTKATQLDQRSIDDDHCHSFANSDSVASSNGYPTFGFALLLYCALFASSVAVQSKRVAQLGNVVFGRTKTQTHTHTHALVVVVVVAARAQYSYIGLGAPGRGRP